LRWAREARRFPLDRAAAKLGLSPEDLQAAEAGERPVTAAQLEAAAELYRRHVAVFFLADVPLEPKPPQDYRRLPQVGQPTMSPALALALREARRRQAVAAELAQALGTTGPRFSIRALPSASPEEVGESLRGALRIGGLAGEGVSAYSTWRPAVEDAGILVFQASGVQVEEMRGVALPGEPPAVVLNAKDSDTARAFSLVHELVHLALDEPGMCDLAIHPRSARLEVFCNATAGAALVPADDLLATGAVASHRGPWDDAALLPLSRHFGVSPEVVLRRLLDLRRATLEDYHEWRSRWEPRRNGGGGGDYYRTVVSRLGRGFVRLALAAYHERVISAAEFGRIVGVKLNRLGRLEALVYA
jgi:Zn-dependent peptidase ImmA (M78 family)/transcriptional regulator with XRE-family HTH domain